ncbi:MAG: DUF6596 domain-containing protein [Thermoleophilaceae bacterium]
MMFACCHPHLARENQVALTLKALCGFGNAEIARALLVGEETVKKRLQRATRDLVDQRIALVPPEADELARRLDGVHQVLYLLFNEGYSSSEGESAIRADLCEEAARLCHLLCSHARFRTPATDALMALMLFHAARLESRLDRRGSVLLLEGQDRDRWDRRYRDRRYRDRRYGDGRHRHRRNGNGGQRRREVGRGGQQAGLRGRRQHRDPRRHERNPEGSLTVSWRERMTHDALSAGTPSRVRQTAR